MYRNGIRCGVLILILSGFVFLLPGCGSRQKAVRKVDTDKKILMHRDLGNAFFKAMDYDRAIVEYTTAINIGSQVYGDNAKSLFPTVYYARGNAYLAKKDFLKALVDYQHISANRFPDTAEAYYNRGYAFFINGNTDMAAADFERALGIDPNIDRNINDTGVQEFIETQVRITGEETQSTSSPTEL